MKHISITLPNGETLVGEVIDEDDSIIHCEDKEGNSFVIEMWVED